MVTPKVLLVGLSERDSAAIATELGAGYLVESLPDSAGIDTVLAGGAPDVVVHDVTPADPVAEDVHRIPWDAWRILREARPPRYLQLSTIALYDEYDARWAVDESWVPRPTTDLALLVPHLAEVTARELTRSLPVEGECLRLRRDGGREAIDVAVVCDRIRRAPSDRPAGSWRAIHPAGARPTAVTGRPEHPSTASRMSPIAEPHAITVFGAGGPLGAAVGSALAATERVVLTDVRTLEAAAAQPPQLRGAPVPDPEQVRAAGHAWQVVDVTDAHAVERAAAGADCLINCSVVRHDPALAFRVNVLGAYRVMSAAAALGIPRVVHTGPALTLAPHPYGHEHDREIGPATPPHVGDEHYLLTKLLALEICRIFAQRHGIACPVLLFTQLVNPAVLRDETAHPFLVSWEDAARAVVAAARVAELPEPAPVLHVTVEAPHGRYSAGPTWDLLGIEPRDRLDHFWYAYEEEERS